MSTITNYKLVALLGLIIVLFSFTAKAPANPIIDKDKLLERHNFYRDEVGVPHLTWSTELTVYAQNWANKLAKNCDMYHSNGKYGENICRAGDTMTEYQVVDLWASEEAKFNHRNPVFKKGVGLKTGHYSQIIWRNTTQMGGAMQECKHGGQIWVCNYNPPGNMIGAKAY